ncbi:MAG: hypothetical protein GY730_11310 [bacterium]|nr:hypothetical protein [bacterium]
MSVIDKEPDSPDEEFKLYDNIHNNYFCWNFKSIFFNYDIQAKDLITENNNKNNECKENKFVEKNNEISDENSAVKEVYKRIAALNFIDTDLKIKLKYETMIALGISDCKLNKKMWLYPVRSFTSDEIIFNKSFIPILNEYFDEIEDPFKMSYLSAPVNLKSDVPFYFKGHVLIGQGSKINKYSFLGDSLINPHMYYLNEYPDNFHDIDFEKFHDSFTASINLKEDLGGYIKNDDAVINFLYPLLEKSPYSVIDILKKGANVSNENVSRNNLMIKTALISLVYPQAKADEQSFFEMDYIINNHPFKLKYDIETHPYHTKHLSLQIYDEQPVKIFRFFSFVRRHKTGYSEFHRNIQSCIINFTSSFKELI